MAGFKLIISADHEVFGNGSGDVAHCMVSPTYKLLDLCDKYGAKVTLFTDVCEYWVFEKEHPEKAKLIKEQWERAIKRGHDVQLHLHPQWLNYNFENGEFELDHQLWRLPAVEESEIEETIPSLIKRGKETLEKFLKPIDQNYTCQVFRAGGWCIQPEEKVLSALVAHEFSIDSTVAPGAYYLHKESWFDFRKSPKKAQWQISNKVTAESVNGPLKEIPIATTFCHPITNFRFELAKKKAGLSLKPRGCSGKPGLGKRSFVKKLIDFLKPQYRMLNFSDGVSFFEMKSITKAYLNRFKKTKGEIPIVMIGHPKTFGGTSEFEKYLDWFKQQPNTTFGTYLKK